MPVAAITMALVFLDVIGLFATPAAKVALLTPFSGLSYAYDYMVSYATGPAVLDLPSALVLRYACLLVACMPLAMRAFRRHQVA